MSKTIRVPKESNPAGWWPGAFTNYIMGQPLLIDRNAALKSQDSPYQTYGCRHYSPNICKCNGMENICAFVEADNICKKPPRSWTKQYEKLSKKDSS